MAEHQGPDFVADCPLRSAAELLAHTWDLVVLSALHEGARRRRALRAAIGGISDKALTEALNRLLARGLVDRNTYREAPPRVEYALTPLGRSFVDGPVRALADWTNAHPNALDERAG